MERVRLCRGCFLGLQVPSMKHDDFGHAFFVCRKAETEIVKIKGCGKMSTDLTDFWWRCFYRCKHEKSEAEMKSLLFKSELRRSLIN